MWEVFLPILISYRCYALEAAQQDSWMGQIFDFSIDESMGPRALEHRSTWD